MSFTPALPANRIEFLKERTLAWQETQRHAIGRRLYHALKGLAATTPETPWMKRKAAVLASIVANMEPEIGEAELVVGSSYYGSDEGMWMEVSLFKPDPARKARLEGYLRQGELSEEQIDFILDALDWVAGQIAHPAYFAERPAEVALADEEGLLCAWATPENHTVIGYEQVLRKGFAALRDEIAVRLDALDWSNPDSVGRKLLLESALQVAESACSLGRRHAQEAAGLLETCPDPERAAELRAIRDACRQVPEFPARSFHEAVQSLWFAHLINTWEDGINANSLGRIDQILYPYYLRDIAAGRLTEGEAREILACLWLKLYRDYDVQQATLGGVDKDGRDTANELTYLMLDVTEELDLIRCLGVRLHKDSPEKLLRRALQIVRRGKGVPFFFNDDALIPALVENGIALEDARDYANIGCIETTIPGKANPHAVSNRVNLLKCLELALNNGASLTTGAQAGPRSGDPGAMQSIDEVIAAYEKQVEYFVTLACFESNRCELNWALSDPMPYKSMLTDGCLESGRDFNAGGPIYNYHETMALGIPNVADSLAAIDELVFRRGKYTMTEVMAQLRENFPNEAIRREFANLPPKYGNDDDRVDRFAVRVFHHFCDVLKKQRNPLGQGYFAQPFTFLWHVDMGAKTAATPDGRRSGEIMAYSLSPMQGRDHSGLTAVLNSLAKLPHARAAGCTSAIIEIDPELFTQENLPLMAAFLRTAISSGVGQLQFNVVNADTLKRAQREPEKYRNLAVRVSGFSQRFCLLSKELQDHIIARTKHTY